MKSEKLSGYAHRRPLSWRCSALGCGGPVPDGSEVGENQHRS